MKHAILFDMDGLLIDSGSIWKDGYNKVLSQYGLDFTDASYFRTAGMRLDEAISFWSSEGLFDAAKNESVAEQIRTYVLETIISCPYMPGAELFLKQVSDMHVPVGLVTATERKIVDAVVEHKGWHQYFDCVVSGSDVVIPKPDPTAYLHAAKVLETPIHDCLIFEDSVPGILAGVRSGGYTIAVPKKGTEKPEILQQAKEVYDSLEDVTLDHIHELLTR